MTFWATLIQLVNTYIFSDWEYLRWIGVLVLVDTALGMGRAWKDGKFSSKGFAGIFPGKIIPYLGALILSNVLQKFTIGGEHPLVFDDIAHGVLIAMIIREAISIFEKIAIFAPGLLPTSVTEKLKAVQDDKRPTE
jgi:phage-related holin